MRKLKITEGEAIVVLGTEDSFAKVKIGNRTLDLRTMELPSTQYKYENSNAQLIADAFNTANKCDMLPSELLGLLKEVYENFKAPVDSYSKEMVQISDKLQKLFINE